MGECYVGKLLLIFKSLLTFEQNIRKIGNYDILCIFDITGPSRSSLASLATTFILETIFLNQPSTDSTIGGH